MKGSNQTTKAVNVETIWRNMLIFIHKHKGFSGINNRNIQITNNKKGYVRIEQNLLHGLFRGNEADSRWDD